MKNFKHLDTAIIIPYHVVSPGLYFYSRRRFFRKTASGNWALICPEKPSIYQEFNDNELVCVLLKEMYGVEGLNYFVENSFVLEDKKFKLSN